MGQLEKNYNKINTSYVPFKPNTVQDRKSFRNGFILRLSVVAGSNEAKPCGEVEEDDGCGERAQSSKKTMFYKLPVDLGAKVLHHHPILPVCFMPLEY